MHGSSYSDLTIENLETVRGSEFMVCDHLSVSSYTRVTNF